ncbi:MULTISPECIES: class C sortase [Actinomycetaceae]|uniref:Class C sortase n=1 Tax=Schaalia turicensis TaxID=131111 RepID=A0ABZ0RD18_9ACTO|nr:class C sortase [Actinotignum sanguinis]WPJ89814.1 class C sortase [Schaalia turicensis]MDK8512589.1 class C sortase [Actinotignum sanguinis]MDK8519466.1 class C sortase [Actinotignum sanguinis]MDK8748341.1 class C sortase [Actinotignum sanguinis]MDY5136077.1 class C sortase [Actinotignum sanguinis]
MKKNLLLPYLIGLLVILGLTLLVYPHAAAWLSQYEQSKVTGAYSEQIATAQPDKDTQLAAAHAYNEAFNAGAVLEANERKATGTGDTTAADGIWPYEKILAADSEGLMARLRIPTIDVDLPVYHGTSDEVLNRAAGHLEGTSLPVGGPSTRAVITAHRGLANARMFTDLNKVNVGDTFTIEVFGDVLTYRVRDTKVVAPEDTDTLRVEEGKDLVTLVTCTPLGINSHRILVTGERIIPTPVADVEAANKPSDLPRFPWFAIAYGVAVLATIGVLARTTWKERRRAQKAAAARKEASAQKVAAAQEE